MNEKLLLVDDDVKLCDLLIRYLSGFGFDVRAFHRPTEALASLDREPYDLAVIDVMMPEMDGFDLLRALKERRDFPVIMLTARSELSDRVLGLESGSDDYVPKPFEPRELVARIRSVLRRSGRSDPGKSPAGESPLIALGDLVLNRGEYSLTVGNERRELTTTEFSLLEIFIESAGRVLTRDVLMEKLHGSTWNAFDRSLDVLVSRLRNQLGDDPKNPRYIKTIRGVGYLFITGAERGSP